LFLSLPTGEGGSADAVGDEMCGKAATVTGLLCVGMLTARPRAPGVPTAGSGDGDSDSSGDDAGDGEGHGEAPGDDAGAASTCTESAPGRAGGVVGAAGPARVDAAFPVAWGDSGGACLPGDGAGAGAGAGPWRCRLSLTSPTMCLKRMGARGRSTNCRSYSAYR
jgi:hypothetical protein